MINPKRLEQNLERFERSAPGRTQRVLDALDKLWICSRTVNYKYTEKQVAAIFKAIRDKVDSVEKGFEPVERPSKKTFALPK